MATTTLNMLFVFLIFGGALALPILQGVKSVSFSVSSSSTRDLNQIDTLVEHNTFRKSEDTEQVKSVHGVPFDHVLVRTKRDLIKGNHGCAEGMVWVWNKCVPIKEYEDAKGDDYYDDS